MDVALFLDLDSDLTNQVIKVSFNETEDEIDVIRYQMPPA